MKIVYSAGNHLGARYQLADFLQHSTDEIKVAAYQAAAEIVPNFHWTLDAVRKDTLATLQRDIQNFQPELVIIDNEPIVAGIAHLLQIPIIYCSPLHLLNGLRWYREKYTRASLVESYRKILNKFPAGMLNMISAPYADINLVSVPGYEWITPYYKKMSPHTSGMVAIVVEKNRAETLKTLLSGFDCHFCQRQDAVYEQAEIIVSDGNTSVVTDAMANQRKLILIPHGQDVEAALHAKMLRQLKFTIDLGQLEFMEKLCRNELEETIERLDLTSIHAEFPAYAPKLHERIRNL
jgi:hypothetical protein